jgi:hypothetical protein
MSVYGVSLLLSIFLLWLIANQVIRFAIFPYSLWFVYTQHHLDTHKRLVEEMVRLFTEFRFVM